jgi:hypothetical protein
MGFFSGNGEEPRNRMREIFTYGSVGRAPGKRCFYPEPDQLKSPPHTIEFEVKLKLFALCILKQMEKIRELLGEKSFAEHRKNEFPYSAFKEFECAYAQAYS